ncbi:MAG: hypothetical protein CO125_02995 [Hydrogenophilales bacterium CG_4_9_14_3_um_filter_59_35]|nr:MAG: hypothetical protein COZ23_13045 [Hydrogenophilales bacterium CG_4_10_14_3_um_filter_58_23]PJB08036.1 MAG: hypothetical protein CO125_02995 [Hydrogenophilales bacterium CG_4_9_14_3_um_filter_59_35]
MKYGQDRGRALLKPDPIPHQLRELSDREKVVIARNREMVHLHMPEMEEFVKELYKAGRIDGWRSVGEVVFRDIGGQDGNA